MPLASSYVWVQEESISIVVGGSKEVAVADDVVAVNSVAVSSILDEIFDLRGEIDCGCLRLICVIEGVVKEYRSVDKGLWSLRNAKPNEARPTVYD